VPRSVELDPITEKIFAPRLIDELVIVIEIAFPAAVVGTVPSGANQARTKDIT
jgi:hypothetical protein